MMLKSIVKKFPIVLSLVLIFAMTFGIGTVFAFPYNDYVGIATVRQATSNSCWAACGSCICRALGFSSIDQSVFARYTGISLDVMVDNIYTVSNGFANAGFQNTVTENPLPFATIQSETYYDRTPIFAGLNYHAIVVAGYSGNSIYTMDPAGAIKAYITYDEAIHGIDNSLIIWMKSIYNFL